jgi:hypothetical protein
VRAHEPDDDGEAEQGRHHVAHPRLVDHRRRPLAAVTPPGREQRPDPAVPLPPPAPSRSSSRSTSARRRRCATDDRSWQQEDVDGAAAAAAMAGWFCRPKNI